MTWVVWRQYRTQLAAGAAVLAGLAVFLLWTHHTMTDYLGSSGLSACVSGGGDCSTFYVAFNDKFRSLLNNSGYFNFLPLLVGLFWGAPLLAREFETGTYRLAWTQSVTRRRWLVVRVGTLIAVAVVAAVAFSLLLSWWFHGFTQVQVNAGGIGDSYTRMDPSVYNFTGVVPVAFTLYALALGVAAGAVFRRTTVAMAVTVAAWLPLRLWVESMRSHFIAPLHASLPLGAALPRGAWILGVEPQGPGGTPLTDGPIKAPCALETVRSKSDACLSAHGFHEVVTYQPVSRFWHFQLIELSIYAGLAVLLFALTYFWVTRRSNG